MKNLIGALLFFGIIYLIVSGNLFLLISVISLIFIVAAHEAGHAYFMRKYGVEIKEFGIGIGSPGNALFYLRIPKISVPIAFHPFLLGAYVIPTEDGEKYMEKLPLKARLQIFGGGVYVNIILAVGLYFLISFLTVLLLLINNLPVPTDLIIVTAIVYSLLIIGIAFRFILTLFSLPVSAPIIIVLLYALFTSMGTGNDNTLVGPIGIISMASNNASILHVLTFAFVITLSIGLFNALPIPPLDGGHMTTAIMKWFKLPNWLIALFTNVCTVLFLAFIVFVIANDIINLF